MTIDALPPVAIRVTRPYADEDEYLEHELDLLTRAGVTLVGAQPRAEGVVLRFELVLVSGHVLLRGEGRVIGFKPDALHGAGGLSLRFTRIDSRSKELIDRAATLRNGRRPSQRPRPPDSVSRSVPARLSTPPPPIATGSVRPPPIASGSVRPPPIASGSVRPPPITTETVSPSAVLTPSVRPPYGVRPANAKPSAAPPNIGENRFADRDALLARLRARAKSLDPAAVRKILALRGSSLVG